MSTADLDHDMALALVTERHVEHAVPTLRELPVVLPVEHLSHSSLGLLHKCPERWRRRYIAREYEPASGPMIVGSAAGAAEGTSLQAKIATGVDLPESDVLDAYADEWNQRAAQDNVDWAGDRPDTIRESGRRALTAYHKLIAPSVKPVSVERKFSLRFEGCEWTFTGYLDLEERDGSVGDLKVKGKRLSKADADSDLQPSAYLLARRAEGSPASEFRFHTMLRTSKPTAELVRTSRTDRQLDAFLARIMAGAAEIAWRVAADVWDGAPAGAWFCQRKYCGYWDRCVWGGLK